MKIFLVDIREVGEDLGFKVVRDYKSCIVCVSASSNFLEFFSLGNFLGMKNKRFISIIKDFRYV